MTSTAGSVLSRITPPRTADTARRYPVTFVASWVTSANSALTRRTGRKLVP